MDGTQKVILDICQVLGNGQGLIAVDVWLRQMCDYARM